MFYKFFNHSVIGLDFSDYSLEVLSLKSAYPKPQVKSYNRLVLDGTVIRDGVIIRYDEAAKLLHGLLLEAHGGPIQERFCLISLPESQVFTYVFKYPAILSDNEIRQSIIYEVGTVLPIKINENYFDFKIIKKDKYDQHILFAAAPKFLIHKYTELLSDVGLIPLAFDLESVSAYRALALTPGTFDVQERVDMLVDIGARTTNAHIFLQGNLVSSFTHPVAGIHCTEAIAKKLQLNFTRAEELKIHVGLQEDKKEGKVFNVIFPKIQEIILVLKRFLLYFQGKYHKTVSSVYLAGGTSLMTGLKEYFTEEFEQKIIVQNPLDKISFINEPIDKKRSLLYANVIGLALRGIGNNPQHEGINLLSGAKRETKKDFLNLCIQKILRL